MVMLSEGFALGRQLRRWWAEHNVYPIVVAESGQWDFLLSMAQACMGIAILPAPLLDQLNLPSAVIPKPLPASELDWAVAHVWGRHCYISHAARAWLASCGAVHDGMQRGIYPDINGRITHL
ncbi:MAG: hypothetical protein KGI52_10110 [Burkholderiales bacterium]|nr:hypothetical protein [Burkholderiales bacterium]